MNKAILSTPALCLVSVLGAAPAHAIGGLGFPNGTAFNGLGANGGGWGLSNGTTFNGKQLNGKSLNGKSLNGKSLNGKQLNGTCQTGAEPVCQRSGAFAIHVVRLADGRVIAVK